MCIKEEPIVKFHDWYVKNLKSGVLEPSAMNLATSTKKGRPSSRMVLLKHYDDSGFVFYTNSKSRKGHEITENPFAALNFYFMDQKRQIRIEGSLKKVSDKEADIYYNSRALGSRIGAHASLQSSTLNSKQDLLDRIEKYEKKFGDAPPRPDYWNGYRLNPNRIEFWQEGDFRIHDRTEFTKDNADETWKTQNLYP